MLEVHLHDLSHHLTDQSRFELSFVNDQVPNRHCFGSMYLSLLLIGTGFRLSTKLVCLFLGHQSMSSL